MRLNTLRPGTGARRAAKRVGRGAATGNGKTCGRGHKGQGARKSPGVRPGFEGGQMPQQRRSPKYGFTSSKAYLSAEVRSGSLCNCEGDVVDLVTLRKARLISRRVTKVKVIAAGELSRPLTVNGLSVTKGARGLIESAGGKVE
jgi:large subunit ribosomal protein L15